MINPASEFDVFPTYVGVILITVLVINTFFGIPHVCGGDPILNNYTTLIY